MIYFIFDGEFVKIGYTQKHLEERLRPYRNYNPREYTVLGTMPGSEKEEKALQKAFRTGRIADTEWFAAEEKLIAFATTCGEIFGTNWSDEETTRIQAPVQNAANRSMLQKAIDFGKNGSTGTASLDEFLRNLRSE